MPQHQPTNSSSVSQRTDALCTDPDYGQQKGAAALAAAAEGHSRSLHSTPRNKAADEGLLLNDEPKLPRFMEHIQHLTLTEADWRHSGWRADRQRIWEGLKSAHESDARLIAFANCGCNAQVQIANDEAGRSHFRLVSEHCHDRLCTPCSTARAAIIAANLFDATHDKEVRFATLTLRCSETPLADQIDRLYRSFTALRRRSFWKTSVSGGAACMEIKIGSGSGRWHVHLHMLVQTRWLDQKRLSAEWHAVTGDSYIVDVRPIGRDRDRVRYVAKYASKGCGPDVLRCPDTLQEYIIAIKGRRLCLTFGSWRGIKLEEHQPEKLDWHPLMSLDRLRSLADAGDRDAIQLLNTLREHFAPANLPTPDQLLFTEDTS